MAVRRRPSAPICWMTSLRFMRRCCGLRMGVRGFVMSIKDLWRTHSCVPRRDSSRRIGQASARVQMRHARVRSPRAFIVSGAVVFIVFLVAPLIGPTTIDATRVLAGQAPDHEVFVSLRVPRVLMAMLTGGSLAVAGALFQALLRDAL